MSEPIFWTLVAIFTPVCLIVVFRDAINRPTPCDQPKLTAAERAAHVQARLRLARQDMARRGVKTLLEGHKGWATVNPMKAPEPAATVIRMRGRK